MITIEQLLESVDLDFEPRWVTKDESGEICIWDDFKPYPEEEIWYNIVQSRNKCFGELKLSEFDGKDWEECIYEVPRKTTGKIERLERHIRIENDYEISCPPDEDEVIEKINELVNAVNELKGAKND